MDESINFAKKYMEDILSFFGLNTDVYATSSDGEVIELHIPSTHLNGFLIGQNAETLRSLQYTVSMALRNGDYEVNRVNVDVADYKKQRAQRLEETAVHWMENVKTSGKPMSLAPMNAADRRTVHKMAEEHGLQTHSQGEGRDRHIVISVAAGDAQPDVAANDAVEVAKVAPDDTAEVSTDK